MHTCSYVHPKKVLLGIKVLESIEGCLDQNGDLPCALIYRGDLDQRAEAASRPKRNGAGVRASLVSSQLYCHHNLVQSFPLEVWHCGFLAGVPHRKQ